MNPDHYININALSHQHFTFAGARAAAGFSGLKWVSSGFCHHFLITPSDPLISIVLLSASVSADKSLLLHHPTQRHLW